MILIFKYIYQNTFPLKTAIYWIEKLNLAKHPEGGWFKEIYRSEDQVASHALPEGFQGDRNFCTSIYYLLEKEDFSALHRIKSDEIWHFYTGTSAVEIISVEHGILKKQILGDKDEPIQFFQIVVPKNCWFAARLLDKNGFALVGCTVSPGFHFNDFEMGTANLINQFPELAGEIKSLIR